MPLHASQQQKAVKFPGSRATPTLKRHKCRAPVAFHAFMHTRCRGSTEDTILKKRLPLAAAGK
jgi:hypothetical protein